MAFCPLGTGSVKVDLTMPEAVRFWRGLEESGLSFGEIGGVLVLVAARFDVVFEGYVDWASDRKAGGGNAKEDPISEGPRFLSNAFKSVELLGVGGALGRGMLG